MNKKTIVTNREVIFSNFIVSFSQNNKNRGQEKPYSQDKLF